MRTGLFLQVEYADISLLGNREDNQDRVATAVAEHASLLVVVDGMGGHADGARAAEVAQQVLLESFWHTPQPLFDPLGFLHLTLGRAHEEVVKIGLHLPLEQRPRATCAVCLVQGSSAWWAHIGDSRVYHLRNGVVTRTRDHSHVELLVREGLITSEQAQTHPIRNFVECCLGGDPIMPDMSLSRRFSLQRGDVLLVCTDGLWSGVRDDDIAAAFGSSPTTSVREILNTLSQSAVRTCAPVSDNTSAAALRWLGP